MRIVLAPNSFKGSATAIEIARWLANGITKSDPAIEVIEAPIADGGDGSLEILQSVGFIRRAIRSVDALGNEIESNIGIRGDTAFIESASIIGLKLLQQSDLDPLRASSFGLGIAIKEALNLGSRKIILGLGGSATTDGGAGAMTALGARFLDQSGRELSLGGGSLVDLASINSEGIDKRISETEFIAVSDVTNPLLGETGSAKVFAPQKGANPSEVLILQEGLAKLASIRTSKFAQSSGAGAAGGLGFMALEFLGATIAEGTTWLMTETGFQQKATGADLIVTGEGRYDSQSITTKVPANVARFAASQRTPIALVCGEIASTPIGFVAAYQLTDLATAEEVMRNPRTYIESIGARIAKECVDLVTK